MEELYNLSSCFTLAIGCMGSEHFFWASSNADYFVVYKADKIVDL